MRLDLRGSARRSKSVSKHPEVVALEPPCPMQWWFSLATATAPLAYLVLGCEVKPWQ